MKSISFLNPVDIRNIVINELTKRDKLISKMQMRQFIKQEVENNLKIIYRELDKLRREIYETKKDY